MCDAGRIIKCRNYLGFQVFKFQMTEDAKIFNKEMVFNNVIKNSQAAASNGKQTIRI